MIRFLISSFVLCFYLVAYSQQNIQVTDLTKIQSASDIHFSPDGSKIVYSVLSIQPDTKDKWEYQYVNQIWMADVASAPIVPRQLTFHKDGATSARWSPDGTRLSFVRSVEGKPQIFILPLTGGEAWQLTNEKNGASNPVWFPDGEALLFSSTIRLQDLVNDSILNPKKELPGWNTEKAGFPDNAYLKTNVSKANPNGTLDEIRTYLNENEKDRKAKVITKLNLQQEAIASNDLSFTHIFQIEIKPDAKSIHLTKGFYSYANPQFIDIDELLISTDMDPQDHPDRSQEGEIYRFSLADHSFTKLLARQGVNYSNAVVSPSGKILAFTQAPISTVSIPKLSIMPIDGKESDIKMITHDRNIGNLQFSADESKLFFTSQSNGGAVVYVVTLSDGKVTALSSFDEGINNVDINGSKAAFTKTAVSSPSEVYIGSIDFKQSQKISDLNTNWLKDKKLSTPEKRSFKNEKGLTVEYWIMKPANFEASKKYPAILNIHGGPTAMWGPGESSMWHEFQYYCSQGYVVVYSNPRGSGGYGEEFMRANIKDWGAGPSSDVLKALDGAVSQGYIDTNRLAMTGGSYAGYLVAWIISHDHRFKAACAQRGVYDLPNFFGEGNAWRLVPNYFGGYPWQPEALKILERESPINYVQNIRTPLIIFHGEQDLRTGVTQGEQLYKSMKVLGKTVEYVRHPGATHELTRSGNNRQRIDQMLRTYEFFERFISTK